ncbi:MAG: tRNA uridine-5-carboxymethylaminomethyl(34) synthesis GTPase MnmE [Alphaproteobacteria bacterium]|nr:tRNA uridine-5-carboxymethylaminomethyl(34) synthesis GTPase MnmE [Alphaproteobacteria bacterium]
METIFALTSGSWQAGVAVVRVSGPKAPQTFERLTGQALPDPRRATMAVLRDNGAVLDHALALYFKGPASFTGEDVVEYHLHGGRAVIDGVLAALARVEGCRLAQPGEFTRRAFENGKMDLTEAEAVADLIAAETEAQRDLALDQLGGGLSRLYGGWADTLAGFLAHQEAEIEFPDEDLPEGIAAGLKDGIETLASDITRHLDDGRKGERLRSGFRVAIIGAPNAGKSSLLNALARRDAAIVSEEAGTTRDIVEVHLNLGGYPFILADTAGLRDTDNAIEVEGIKRAARAAEDADLKIAVFDAAQDKDTATQALVDDKTIIVLSKADLVDAAVDTGAVLLSSKTGTGIDVLLKTLAARAEEAFKNKNDGAVLTRTRHREALLECSDALSRTLHAALPELAAEDLRMALRALGRITGRVHVEELLDKIFKDFCIGK